MHQLLRVLLATLCLAAPCALAQVPGVSEPGDLFGWALATGDFDGDGFDDLAVGVPEEDVDGVADAGAVHVFVSTADGRISRGGGLFLTQGGPLATPAEAGAPDAAVALRPPAPNPSATRAALRYALDASANVRLTVYDMLGREVAVVAEGARAAGAHTAPVDVSAWPAGVYLVRLDVGGEALTQRLTVAR